MGAATLAQILSDTLRQDLRDGVYLCGERLAESVLARQYNVSQNTARDALKLLEAEGWVIKHARRGVYVRQFSNAEAEELYTLRATLENLVLNWAMQAMNEQNQAQLAQIIAQARIQANSENDNGVWDAINTFHETLLRIADHPMTLGILQPILNQCRLLMNLRQRYD
ncbi:MAG: hypothetical protein CUN56_14335, partial [Phototrophicales bacterium]